MQTPERIVRLKTVLARTSLSRSTIYRKIAEGICPAHIIALNMGELPLDCIGMPAPALIGERGERCPKTVGGHVVRPYIQTS